MGEKNTKSWEILPEPWQDFARKYIGPTQGKSDVVVGVKNERFAELFPFETVEENKDHARKVLDGLSKILAIPRQDMNLGVIFDDTETLTAGCPQALHYTHRYHGGRIERHYDHVL